MSAKILQAQRICALTSMQRIKKKYRDLSSPELARLCAGIGLDRKAADVVILDVRGLSSFTDFFVIMSGRSTRHVQGLAEAIQEKLKNKRLSADNSEGVREGHWILLDYNDVVVHIFYEEARRFYDLEGLWHDAERVTPGR